MAKPMTPVDRAKLTAALVEAEKDGPLPNLTKLWERAAEIYNAMPGVQPITFSVVLLRAKEWGIQVKTTPGRKGGPLTEERKQAMQAARGQRVPRAEKMKEFKTFDLLRADLSKDADKRRFLPVVDAAEKGSLRAAIKLNCLDCCNWQTSEIKQCGIEGCPMYPHRPYKQGQADQGDEAGDESVPDEELEEAAA